jgi:hypothetical protein
LRALEKDESWEKKIVPEGRDAFLEEKQFPGGLSAKREKNQIWTRETYHL